MGGLEIAQDGHSQQELTRSGSDRNSPGDAATRQDVCETSLLYHIHNDETFRRLRTRQLATPPILPDYAKSDDIWLYKSPPHLAVTEQRKRAAEALLRVSTTPSVPRAAGQQSVACRCARDGRVGVQSDAILGVSRGPLSSIGLCSNALPCLTSLLWA